MVVRRAPYGDNPVVGDRARKTHERILRVALRAFDRYGFDEANMDDIARLARTSRATLYQYFESKHDILEALSSTVGAEIIATVDRLDPIGPGPDDRARFVDWVIEIQGLMAANRAVLDVWNTATEREGFGELGTAFMRRFGRRFSKKVVLPSGSGLDPDVLAMTMLAVIEGVGDHVARLPSAEAAEVLAATGAMLHDGMFPAG